MPVSDTLMRFLCSPQTLNKNNLLPPEESCNFFPSPMPQTNVYATTYYPTPLGKYDFPPLDSPCSYMHSWWTHLQTFGFNVCMCVCDRVHTCICPHRCIWKRADIQECRVHGLGKRKVTFRAEIELTWGKLFQMVYCSIKTQNMYCILAKHWGIGGGWDFVDAKTLKK